MSTLFERFREVIEEEGESLRLEIVSRVMKKTGHSQDTCEQFISRITNSGIVALDRQLKKEGL